METAEGRMYMRASERISCERSGSSRPFFAVVLASVIFLAIQATAQTNSSTYVSPPVAPHVFNGDLSKLPPSKPKNLHAPVRKTLPGAPFRPHQPGFPDPLWQNRISNLSTLAPGVT